MLIHPWDQASAEEARAVLDTVRFGQLIATGRHRDYPVVVPSHFSMRGDDEVWLHLARPNPVWRAIEENPHVVLAVVADYTYVEAAWNADEDVPLEHGVPTSYYAAVQLQCVAEIVDDPDRKLEILRTQLADLEPDGSHREPPSAAVESDRRQLPGIRGLRLQVRSVQAKLKYGGNRSVGKRLEIADHLGRRNGPHDAAAREHLLRRTEGDGWSRVDPGDAVGPP